MPTLYDFTMAPSPRRARILLAEKGIPHTTVQVDLVTGEHLGEAFRALNPQCTVPALQLDDGSVLPDNAAIAAWAEAAHPEPALLGRTPLEKAEVASWNSRIEFEGLLALAEAMRNSAPAMKDRALTGPASVAQIPELAQRGLERARRFLDVLDAHLAQREFIATERFSIADITAAVMVDFARVVRLKPAETHPNIRRWREALAQRPSLSA
ncbi:MAG: glutathione S-transferase N-terminal domain-containing protein [Proteobacteria bacterium]|uniref:glutathione S-transferase family protein n=1 Tax=Aquabacterium sp. TaxID=1872578 RepID=UPI0035C6A5B2|nr:glutathione S-transferase N-terminal domain-containing protein [Pseudomonadota bacterium]